MHILYVCTIQQVNLTDKNTWGRGRPGPDMGLPCLLPPQAWCPEISHRAPVFAGNQRPATPWAPSDQWCLSHRMGKNISPLLYTPISPISPFHGVNSPPHERCRMCLIRKGWRSTVFRPIYFIDTLGVALRSTDIAVDHKEKYETGSLL